jgi:hypothetical protein
MNFSHALASGVADVSVVPQVAQVQDPESSELRKMTITTRVSALLFFDGVGTNITHQLLEHEPRRERAQPYAVCRVRGRQSCLHVGVL